MTTFQKIKGHLGTVCKHKKYVYQCMRDCGHPIQGIFHDMSKFSWAELKNSIKYYQGTRSPIEAEKEDLGYSTVWFHHRGRNNHHSQYWCDISFGEVKPCKMPSKYLIELICDGVGAGKAYSGANWTKENPYNYFKTKDFKTFYHDDTREVLEAAYQYIYVNGWDAFAKLMKSHRKDDIYKMYESGQFGICVIIH